MTPHVRHPIWLPTAPAPGVTVFALLFFVETCARAILSTVVPLQAYDLLRDESTVSFVYTGVGLLAMVFSFSIPLLIRAMARRWVFTLGAILLVGAAVTLATVTIPGQVAGMLLRVMGTACLNVTVSLYILDHIEKHDYVKNDAARLGFSTIGWAIAPYGGVWLYDTHGPWAVFGLSAGASVVLVALFWYLRLSENTVLSAARRATPLPWQALRRFWDQPRLRLAWFIAFSRSAFWATFFIYGPILMVTGGLGREAGGLLVSIGNAMLITIFLTGGLARRHGIRRVSAVCFLGGAAFAAAAGVAGTDAPELCAAFLLGAALLVVPLDAVGGVPFYRAARPMERAAMTSVYRSYLDVSDLLPALVYGLLLLVFGLGAVFLALAGLLAVCGLLCLRHLHRRL